MCYYDNNKEINLKIFKLKYAYVLIETDENLFKKYLFTHWQHQQINQKRIRSLLTILKKNKDKIYEQDDFDNFFIQPGYKRGDLVDAVKIIIGYNEVIKLDGD